MTRLCTYHPPSAGAGDAQGVSPHCTKNSSENMHRYNSDQDAARGLLVESVAILSSTGVDYAIVGGWVPFLFPHRRVGAGLSRLTAVPLP